MTVWSITVGRDELLAVGDVLCTHRPAELEGGGVWVRSVDGRRVWSVRNAGALWEVVGDEVTGVVEPRCLPDRLVWNARQLASVEGSEDVTITIPDDKVAFARNDLGRSVVDLPTESEVPRLPMYYEEGASATLPAVAFIELVRRAAISPRGFDGVGPTAFLVIDDGEVVVSIDWTPHRGLRTTQGVPASTKGSQSRALRIVTLGDLTQYLEPEGDVHIVLPRDEGIPMTVVGSTFRFALDRLKHGARQHHDALLHELELATGGECRVVDEGEFAVWIGERSIRVSLVDDPAESIRLTTQVCTGVEATAELLSQINRTNADLNTARLWHEDGIVWARSDLPVAAIDSIGVALRNLDHQVRGFDVFLGGYGIGA